MLRAKPRKSGPSFKDLERAVLAARDAKREHPTKETFEAEQRIALVFHRASMERDRKRGVLTSHPRNGGV